MKNLNLLKEYFANIIDDFKFKNLFSGYGFYKDKYMFGVYFKGAFCIRAKDELANYIKENFGGISFLSEDQNISFRLSHYYILPFELFNKPDILKELVLKSVEQVRNENLTMQSLKKKNIKDLPNLSIKQERMLRKIGVIDVETFRKLGAVTCFVELRKIGFELSLSIFFDFVGAILNTHSYVIPKEIRKLELEKLNKALIANKFKPLLEDSD